MNDTTTTSGGGVLVAHNSATKIEYPQCGLCFEKFDTDLTLLSKQRHHRLPISCRECGSYTICYSCLVEHERYHQRSRGRQGRRHGNNHSQVRLPCPACRSPQAFDAAAPVVNRILCQFMEECRRAHSDKSSRAKKPQAERRPKEKSSVIETPSKRRPFKRHHDGERLNRSQQPLETQNRSHPMNQQRAATQHQVHWQQPPQQQQQQQQHQQQQQMGQLFDSAQGFANWQPYRAAFRMATTAFPTVRPGLSVWPAQQQQQQQQTTTPRLFFLSETNHNDVLRQQQEAHSFFQQQGCYSQTSHH